MFRMLIAFWPILIPPICYFIWLGIARYKARKNQTSITRFTDGPWVVVVIVTLLTAIACFLFWGLSFEPTHGTYEPPHMEKGRIVPGHIKSQ